MKFRITIEVIDDEGIEVLASTVGLTEDVGSYASATQWVRENLVSTKMNAVLGQRDGEPDEASD